MKRKRISAAVKLTSNEREAANRAEVTAILIPAGFRVYRPEADCHGEDLILRTPEGKFCAVQLKARPEVNQRKYGGKSLWMLFPEIRWVPGRKWFLIPHDEFYEWTEEKHGRAPAWKKAWSYPGISKELRAFLEKFVVAPPKDSSSKS